jgi:hypothetical protein
MIGVFGVTRIELRVALQIVDHRMRSELSGTGFGLIGNDKSVLSQRSPVFL